MDSPELIWLWLQSPSRLPIFCIALSGSCSARSSASCRASGLIATMAMLLPATFALPPLTALIMLAGIYGRSMAARRAPFC